MNEEEIKTVQKLDFKSLLFNHLNRLSVVSVGKDTIAWIDGVNTFGSFLISYYDEETRKELNLLRLRENEELENAKNDFKSLHHVIPTWEAYMERETSIKTKYASLNLEVYMKTIHRKGLLLEETKKSD